MTVLKLSQITGIPAEISGLCIHTFCSSSFPDGYLKAKAIIKSHMFKGLRCSDRSSKSAYAGIEAVLGCERFIAI